MATEFARNFWILHMYKIVSLHAKAVFQCLLIQSSIAIRIGNLINQMDKRYPTRRIQGAAANQLSIHSSVYVRCRPVPCI